ncbi:MAG: transporter substrate-binding domain-containing protein, partial [Ensifer adhaerens]
TEERKEKFDFSTYRKDELGFYAKADSKIQAIKAPKDIAGLKVITDAGTNQEKILLEWDRQNLAAGLSAIAINGKTKLVGTVSGGWPISAEIAVTTRKDSGLAEPLTGVINDLIASGDYRKILETWKLGPEAIEKAQTNPPGLPKSGS